MIKYSIRGGNIEVTGAIRNYVELKLGKIEKHFHAEQGLDARVNFKVYREKTAKIEVIILVDSIILRAEDVLQDMYGSIDLITDKIERQIRKNKTKIAKRHHEKLPVSQIFTGEFEAEPVKEGPVVKVVRTKRVNLGPMDIDEALLQIDLLGHDFFIYTDAEDGVTNVLYRHEDGGLGLIETK